MSTIPSPDKIGVPQVAAEALSQPRRISTLWQWLCRAIPTAVTVCALGGVAYWGHRTDWTVPAFSALIGRDHRPDDDWCAEHNVPESQCLECKKTLLPPIKDYGWCAEHGVTQCPLHHPDVAQLNSVPRVTRDDFDRAARALALLPRAQNDNECDLYQRRIQLASTEVAEKVGLDVAVVEVRPIVEALIANGEVGYDETRMAHLASRVAGIVWRAERKVGARVVKGDVLAVIDSADVGRAKSEFLQAIAQVRLNEKILERMRPAVQTGAIPERRLLETETAYQESRIRLQTAQQSLVNLGLPVRVEELADVATDKIGNRIQFLGLPASIVSKLDHGSTTSNLIPVRSSLDGIVVDRHVVEGEVVDPKTTLMTVADMSHLWLTLSVRQEDAKYLSLGQAVLFRSSDGKNEQEIKGALSWISTAADEQTRTVKVRVDLPNAGGRLRAHTFGTGRIVLREEPKAMVVPSESVHWDGVCNVVFVRDKNYEQPDSFKFFHVRSVRLGVTEGDTTEIIAGLLPGEVVAAKNSVVLEAQLLKDSLGEGCGCADGH